ncbi:MAG: sialate O-acetylesterase [Clostridia bacterium]|nr:sialate O-acetylesterase [Clostridia bacterium]
MAGRGEFGEVEEIENKECFMLRMGRWQTMSEPINPDRSIFKGKFHSGISLGASFADNIQKKLDTKVGLIPCADGGTKLDEWMPGTVLFDHAVMMASLAKRTSALAGVIWHQGESDCHNDSDVNEYEKKFVTFLKELRRALGDENLPVIIGEISENTDHTWGIYDRAPKLNKVLHGVADADPFCGIVRAAELPLKPDGLHFNSASLRILGERYAEKYLSLL